MDGVALHAQRLALDQRRPAAVARLLDRALRLAVDGEHVGAVDDDARRSRTRPRGRRGARPRSRGASASSTPTGCCRRRTRPAAGARRRSSSPRACRRARPRPRRTSRPRRAAPRGSGTRARSRRRRGASPGRWLTMAISPRRASAMCTLPSLPVVGPSARPMYWAKMRHGSTPRTMWTPMSRCSGVPTSSGPIAVAIADGGAPRCRGRCRTSPGIFPCL